MELSNILGKKKNQRRSLTSHTDIGLLTTALLTLNKAIRAKLNEQRYFSFQKQRQRQKQQDLLLILAGLIGGLVAGAISALLIAPESGSEFRGRLSGLFGNGHDEDSAIEQASEKAEELAETAK
ncbi:MAG: YtxH domain-containing protein, partial [Bacteroidota bacterium]